MLGGLQRSEIWLWAVSLTLFFGLAHFAFSESPERVFDERKVPLSIQLSALTFDPNAPARRDFGPFTFVEGFEVTSTDERFGGLSAIDSGADEKAFDLLSDRGFFIQGLKLQAGQQTVKAARFSFANEDHRAFDAEGLARLKGQTLVSFELVNKIYTATALDAPLSLSKLNACLDGLKLWKNGGLEAIDRFDEGRVIAVAERGRDEKGHLPAVICGVDGVERAGFVAPLNYAPTALRTLPNGDFLVLLRRFNIEEGLGIKIQYLRRTDAVQNAVWQAVDLVTFEKPLSVDNMEGMVLQKRSDGGVRVLLVSDDNYNPVQKTLLLVFDLDRAKLAALLR